jgi:hypothetical protein
MKHKIADKDTMIEKKSLEIYPFKNNCNYMFNTNELNPVKVEKVKDVMFFRHLVMSCYNNVSIL